MKKKGIHIVSIVLSLVFLFSLTSCQSASDIQQGKSASSQPAVSSQAAASSQSAGSGGEDSPSAAKSYVVGISEFSINPSLDNCRQGFLEGLAEEGIKEGENLEVLYQNSNADTGMADQIARDFVSKKVDLIAAIATPSAMYAYTEAQESGLPVIYVAISDPVEAKLAKEDKSSVGEVTGISDALPIEAQLKMIRKIQPEAKSIGIIYTTSEANSVSNIRKYQELAPKYGFQLETVGIGKADEIPMAVDSLLSKVDCLNNMTDLQVVNALPLILQKAGEKGIPVYGSEIEQVREGCLACEGIEYVSLGKQAGRMAAKVLKGEKKASELPYETAEESFFYINQAVADQLKIELKPEVKAEASEVFQKIEAIDQGGEQ